MRNAPAAGLNFRDQQATLHLQRVSSSVRASSLPVGTGCSCKEAGGHANRCSSCNSGARGVQCDHVISGKCPGSSRGQGASAAVPSPAAGSGQARRGCRSGDQHDKQRHGKHELVALAKTFGSSAGQVQSPPCKLAQLGCLQPHILLLTYTCNHLGHIGCWHPAVLLLHQAPATLLLPHVLHCMLTSAIVPASGCKNISGL